MIPKQKTKTTKISSGLVWRTVEHCLSCFFELVGANVYQYLLYNYGCRLRGFAGDMKMASELLPQTVLIKIVWIYVHLYIYTYTLYVKIVAR